LTTTAPKLPKGKERPSSAPWPAVPLAVMTGLGKVTDPTATPIRVLVALTIA
jgi:hypothetical protein